MTDAMNHDMKAGNTRDPRHEGIAAVPNSGVVETRVLIIGISSKPITIEVPAAVGDDFAGLFMPTIAFLGTFLASRTILTSSHKSNTAYYSSTATSRVDTGASPVSLATSQVDTATSYENTTTSYLDAASPTWIYITSLPSHQHSTVSSFTVPPISPLSINSKESDGAKMALVSVCSIAFAGVVLFLIAFVLGMKRHQQSRQEVPMQNVPNRDIQGENRNREPPLDVNDDYVDYISLDEPRAPPSLKNSFRIIHKPFPLRSGTIEDVEEGHQSTRKLCRLSTTPTSPVSLWSDWSAKVSWNGLQRKQSEDWK